MKFKLKHFALTAIAASFLVACSKAPEQKTDALGAPLTVEYIGDKSRLDIYHPVELTADLSHLSKKQQEMLGVLIDASEIMDDLFWMQAFGEDKASFLDKIKDPKVRAFAEINYGPWDRLNGDKPFLSGYAEKFPGAEFYPADMSKAEFEKLKLADKDGSYSIIERNKKGKLEIAPYHQEFQGEMRRAASLLITAASYAEDEEFKNYLELSFTQRI